MVKTGANTASVNGRNIQFKSVSHALGGANNQNQQEQLNTNMRPAATFQQQQQHVTGTPGGLGVRRSQSHQTSGQHVHTPQQMKSGSVAMGVGQSNSLTNRAKAAISALAPSMMQQSPSQAPIGGNPNVVKSSSSSTSQGSSVSGSAPLLRPAAIVNDMPKVPVMNTNSNTRVVNINKQFSNGQNVQNVNTNGQMQQVPFLDHSMKPVSTNAGSNSRNMSPAELK